MIKDIIIHDRTAPGPNTPDHPQALVPLPKIPARATALPSIVRCGGLPTRYRHTRQRRQRRASVLSSARLPVLSSDRPSFFVPARCPPDLCSMGRLSCGFNARRKPSRKRRSQLQQTFDVLEENVDLLIVLGHFACQLFVGGQHLAWPHEGPGGLRVAGRSPIADLFSLCMLSCIYVRMRTCKTPKARTGSAQTPSQEYFHPWQSK